MAPMTIAEKIKAATAKVAQGSGRTAPEVTSINSSSLKVNAKSGQLLPVFSEAK